jgi:hypothetical protein
MPLWMLIVSLVVLLKLVIASLMLWIPFRNDAAMQMTDTAPVAPTASDDDGGSRTLPDGPQHGPHPRTPSPHLPRRGPHGSEPAPSSPARVRPPTPVVSAKRIRA